MIIELYGGNFVNKGAELMLRTAIGRLSQLIPDFTPAVFPEDDRFQARAALGIRLLLPSRGRVNSLLSTVGRVEQLVASVGGGKYRKLLDWYGLLDVSMVDALVSVSGFAFSDVWGTKYSARFLQVAKSYRRRHAPIVLLPQALGPFRTPGVKESFKRMGAMADLIYARDAESFSYTKEVLPDHPGVYQAPDITLFDGFDGHASEKEEEGYCCLVPNARVLDQTGQRWGDKYEACMQAAGRAVTEKGFAVKILLHTAERADLKLAERLCAELGGDRVETVIRDDPYELKRLLARSRLVIGSRYHSLVSAFSQGTPAIALGWAHKYRQLFADFGLEQYALDDTVTPEEVAAATREILQDVRNSAIRLQLADRLSAFAVQNEQMWGKVAAVLRSGHAGRLL